MDGTKIRMIREIDKNAEALWQIATEIGLNPEEGFREFKAVKLLTACLQANGFQVERPVGGMETAFLARFKRGKEGPKIAFLAEYDALPEIGHGCGHNLIGTASVGAAVSLSKMPEVAGEIWVVGSPAEETSGGKVLLAAQGVFAGVDAALMFHPGTCNTIEISSQALDAIEITYLGEAAHAALSDRFGINALDAMIGLFVLLGKLKKDLCEGEKIDGIIIEGGKAPNIVPDKTVGKFYLRATDRKKLDQIKEHVLDCAVKAAQEVGAQMQWRYFEHSYQEMISNSTLAKSFQENLEQLGITEIEPPQTMLGSVDMGNVSLQVPAIHPYLQMGDGMYIAHTKEFAGAAVGQAGREVLFIAAKALAMTGWDILTDEQFLFDLKQEFQKTKTNKTR
ncbi:amidohydrolase [Syntrophobotulus glycolicus DSM 8271]|uniref:Peptidase M20 domain-containing protein 2 n=1 Tax=Syntrophobotulus glycolicus (strain DSM 8271 / FlGlyR) TaxID=645991 RepID=F0SY44_SYNGF|nr:M20 family metallopeptidase [Syntrophobotulus glycolicus]ADY54794.1 amidohydrolase [Syntrophobotulus glycolicus DSM 8271]